MNRAVVLDDDEEWTMDDFDKLDIASLCQLVGSFMPIIKLDKEDSFLLGAEAKQIVTRGDNCMVRVGGGFVTIAEYYNKYSVKQCVQLFHLMNANSWTFKEVVV